MCTSYDRLYWATALTWRGGCDDLSGLSQSIVSVRRFACVLEDDPGVEKRIKSTKGQFQLFYPHQHQDQQYEPDFAVETKTEELLCKPKRATEMTDAVMLAKARSTVEW